MLERRALLVGTRGFTIASSRKPLVQSLRQRGFVVSVAAARDVHSRSVEQAGASFIDVPFTGGGIALRRDLISYVRLRRLLVTQTWDVVHAFNTKPTVLSGLAARPFAGRLVVTVTGRGTAMWTKGAFGSAVAALYRVALQRPDRVIFQNRDDLDFFTSRGYVEPSKVRLIVSSGVDLQRFPKGAAAIRPTRTPRRVLFLGRLLESKGVTDLVDAMALLQAEGVGAELLIAGERSPGARDAVDPERILAPLKPGSARFLGYIEDVPDLLRRVDVLVAPSRIGEGVPRVVLEAGAASLPVVSTDVVGPREVIEDGFNGYLVPPRDPAALADRIGRLIRDPGSARPMGTRARARIEERFDQRDITSAILEVYRELGVLGPDGPDAR